MKRFATWVATIVLCLGIVLPIGAAETSQTIAFSGCDPNLTGPVDVRLRLFTASTGGMLVFEETQMGVDGSSGCISVQAGNATPGGLPAALFVSNPSLWVAFAMDSDPSTEFGGGRTPVTANGYAFLASQAITAQSAATAQTFVPGATVMGDVVTSVLSITNANPNGKGLEVQGSQAGIVGRSASSTGNVAGVQGETSSTTGYGVVGRATSTSGYNIGVYGESQSRNGIGVQGRGGVIGVQGLSTAGTGVFGESSTSNGVYGATGSGTGVYGISYTPAGWAGRFDGKVQITTATANYGLLHTDGEVVVGSWVGAGSAGSKGGWLGTKSNHPLRFFTNDSSAQMTLSTNGNVGIGTTTPAAKLDVAGNIRVGTGVSNSGGGFKHVRVGPFTLSAGAYATSFVVNWPTPFADTNYTVVATLEESFFLTGATVGRILSKTQNGISLAVQRTAAASAETFFINVIAIHD